MWMHLAGVGIKLIRSNSNPVGWTDDNRRLCQPFQNAKILTACAFRQRATSRLFVAYLFVHRHGCVFGEEDQAHGLVQPPEVLGAEHTRRGVGKLKTSSRSSSIEVGTELHQGLNKRTFHDVTKMTSL